MAFIKSILFICAALMLSFASAEDTIVPVSLRFLLFSIALLTHNMKLNKFQNHLSILQF